jgi:hypothetical protein
MKHIFSIMVIIALFIGCESERQETTIIQHEIGNDFLTTESGVIIFGTHQDPVQAAIQTWVRGSELVFQIEGNFTGSGNREIIGFYELRNFTGIDQAFCFVLDSSGETIEKVFKIDFRTATFTDRHEAITGLSNELGSPIIRNDRIIGRFGDFNNNGRDELYLFENTFGFLLQFLEFNGTEFAQILELDRFRVTEAFIVGIDPVEKQLL